MYADLHIVPKPTLTMVVFVNHNLTAVFRLSGDFLVPR